ncbi:HAD family hydrolase [Falsihalocynthiibacter sp. SS001]|uniref:HAD family hydrolase n=1 Tax=Falsihalocynthiibacter sp. SS001 TaxID=3349698 RepID=UPI0036D29FBD
MTSIRAVLFDKDGTLFDFKASWGQWTQRYLAQLAGGDDMKRRELANAVGFDIDRRRFESDSPIIAGTPDEIAEVLLPHLPSEGREGLLLSMNRATMQAEMVEAAPLRPLLRGLRARGLTLGVATNDAEEPARAHLKAADVEEYFDYLVGFDSGYGAKPAAGMCTGFSEQIGVPADEIVMVGDSRHDLLAGRAAGMRTVAVLTGIAQEDSLAPLAEVVLPHIGHLPAWLEGVSPAEKFERTAV